MKNDTKRMTKHATRLTCCFIEDEHTSVAARRYADRVARLLGSDLKFASDGIGEQAGDGGDPSMLVIVEQERMAEIFLDRQLKRCGLERSSTHLATGSLLAIHHPRWPLERLLLLARGTHEDEAAVAWALAIAQASGASTTLLVVSDAETMRELHTRPRVAELLSLETGTGRYLRHFTTLFVDRGLASVLKVRTGEPVWQVRHELASISYDLVIVAAESLLDKSEGGGQLLNFATRAARQPVLIAGMAPREGSESRPQ